MATAGRILIIPKGRYNEESTYDMLDMVSFGGKGWICKKTCIGIEPTEGEYWAECIDMSEEFADLESKTNPLHAVYIDEIDEVIDSTTPEHPYIIGHSIALEELGIGSMVSVEILSPSEDYICQNAVGESGTASRVYDSEKGWGEWFVNAIPKYDDITETTESTMPNSHEGRLLFKEIVGKTEKLTSTGANLFNPNAISKGYELNQNGSTSPNNNYWVSDYIKVDGGKSYYLTKGLSKNGVSNCFYDANKTFISSVSKNEGLLTTPSNARYVRFNGTDTQLIMFNEGDTALPYEPYGVGTPFIRSVEISKITTHGKNILNATMPTTTQCSVVAINNGDGTYTLNGIATNGVCWFVVGAVSLKANKQYKVCGTPKHLTECGICIEGLENPKDSGEGFIYTPSKDEVKKIYIHIPAGEATNATFKPMVTEDLDATYDTFEEGGSYFALSTPIELNKVGDVQDVIVDGKINKRLERVVFDGTEAFEVISGSSGGGYEYRMNLKRQAMNSSHSTCANAICNVANVNDAVFSWNNNVEMFAITNNVFYLRQPSWTDVTNVDTLKAKLKSLYDSGNPVHAVYEVATPITDMPVADQIALNSIKSCDDITYLEFDSPLEPTFKADYGTSKLGGYRLEALQMAKCNGIRISALEASVVNNI